MGVRGLTASYIDSIAVREGGMSAFEEYYIDDFAPDDRVCAAMVECRTDWRRGVRLQRHSRFARTVR